MEKWTAPGKCNLCGETFDKKGMTRHLTACRKTHQIEKLEGRGKARQTQLFHLIVEGSHRPDIGCLIAVPAEAALRDLDQFLRDIWLECCGHLSAFTIEKVQYELNMGGIDAMWPAFFGPSAPPKSMKTLLGEVLRPRLKFSHEYDFGTTTTLTLKVAAAYEGQAKGKAVQILARNDPPPYVCESCGQPATQLCGQCLWEGAGFVCEECAPEHACGPEMLLPVVNSPRMGMCGYTGQAY